MKHGSITALELLLEDGSATLINALAELLAIQIKSHGHFGNVMHHVSGGNWSAVEDAMRELFVLPHACDTLSPLARNLVTMLHRSSAANLRSFGPWLLDRVERQTTALFRRSLERRLDDLEGQIRQMEFAFTKSAARILSDVR
jgi:hypothetical protein